MKSQVLILLLVTIGACLFQSTHQYRLKKRELTVDFFVSFIVNACSARKVDTLIQNLCDKTLQDAVMGNFAPLITHCKKKGSSTRYCNAVNHRTRPTRSVAAKRSLERRSVRSVNGDRRMQTTDDELGLEQTGVARMCMSMNEKSSMEVQRLCNRTLKEIQRGRYSQITTLCQFHPDSNYCQLVLSFSSSLPWPASEASAPRIHPSSVPLEIVKSFRVKPVIEH